MEQNNEQKGNEVQSVNQDNVEAHEEEEVKQDQKKVS